MWPGEFHGRSIARVFVWMEEQWADRNRSPDKHDTVMPAQAGIQGRGVRSSHWD